MRATMREGLSVLTVAVAEPLAHVLRRKQLPCRQAANVVGEAARRMLTLTGIVTVRTVVLPHALLYGPLFMTVILCY